MGGYIIDGQFIQFKDKTSQLQLAIGKEIEKVYEKRFGRKFTTKRFNEELSTPEQEQVIHEASVRVQDRRKGRLVP